MSALELLALIREANPGVRYARYHNDSAIGEWVPSKGRFVPVYQALLGGKWACMIQDGVLKETLANGELIYKPELWIE